MLERLDHVGGAAVSAPVFPGIDARLSRYSYLVSLLPRQVIDELGLDITLKRRRYSSYTPVGDRGLLVDDGDPERTAASFRRLTGGSGDLAAWQRFYAMTGHVAARVFPTMTERLPARDALRERVGDHAAWEALFERPVGEVVAEAFADDVVRGVVLTDALIGTFADLTEDSLQQNRCLLYHVIGGGTGDWDVPVGGMGAVSDALRDAALVAGATIRVGARATAVDPAGEVEFTDTAGGSHRVGAGHVLAGCAPATLDRLLGGEASEQVEGAQLKINMLLSRLPRLREHVGSLDTVAAFSGTFHVNQSMSQLQTAYAQAAAGAVPELPPCEIYCHSLTDPSILGPDLQRSGAHTLTLFGLHMPTRLFRGDNDRVREVAVSRTLASLNAVLAEPIEDCLLPDADGRPCLEARSPVDLETDVGLPGGNIFQRPLSWPYAETEDEVGRWGVETAHEQVLLAGAGARRGGGVSGIAGRAAAMAVLDA